MNGFAGTFEPASALDKNPQTLPQITLMTLINMDQKEFKRTILNL